MKTDVLKTVKQTIRQNTLIQKGDHIVLGLSGGPDSVCLFSVLRKLSEELDITLEAVHINHKFRPGAAELDARYVQSICDEAGIICRQYETDCIQKAADEGLTVEEAGRIARYEAFDEVAGRHDGPVKIAVAQNADDQYETMLFRLMRGTGPDGLAAIQYERKSDRGFSIIRPLLDVEKKDILEYCKAEGLSPRIDYTNEQTKYTRNRIRLELIPYIEKNFNSGFRNSLSRLSSVLNDDRDYMWHQTSEAMEQVCRDGITDVKALAGFHRSIRTRVIMKLAEAAGLTEDIAMTHIRAIDELVCKNSPSGRINLPAGFEAVFEYGALRITNSTDENLEHNTEARKLTAVFDTDEIKKAHPGGEIVIRTRQPGDYIHIGTGSKKIQDLFVDLKIPKDRRDDIQLAAVDSEVLWVAGYRYSSRYKVTADTKNTQKVEIFVTA